MKTNSKRSNRASMDTENGIYCNGKWRDRGVSEDKTKPRCLLPLGNGFLRLLGGEGQREKSYGFVWKGSNSLEG